MPAAAASSLGLATYISKIITFIKYRHKTGLVHRFMVASNLIDRCIMSTPTTQHPADTLTDASISELMRNFSIEVTPKGALKIDDFSDYLMQGTWVYVTSLPGAPFGDLVSTCKKLSDQGMQPVPHITARSLSSQKHLEASLETLTSEAGVTRVLALAGADKKPAGNFVDTISMLETGLFDKYKIRSIGIAGHPEGSPDIQGSELRSHGYKKIEYSERTNVDMYLITQFVFDAKPIIDWAERIRSEGNNLPVVVGIPGLASLTSLIGHARACGIGPSMSILTRQAKHVGKLLKLQEPDKLIRDLASYNVNKPDSNIAGLHMYPLGGFKPTALWSRSVLERKFKLNSAGFSISE